MDIKSPLPNAQETETVPPAYSESAPPYAPPSSNSSYYSHQIQDQLQHITTQIKSTTTQKHLLSHAKDEKILLLLTTQIQIYLSDFAKTGLHRGTLILVPARAVESEKAVPVEYDFKSEDEYDRVVRVRDKDGDPSSNNFEFTVGDENRGDQMFWRDEEMARRLVGYLRPKKDLKNAALPLRKEVVKAAEKAEMVMGRGFWGRKKSIAKPIERPILVAEQGKHKSELEVKATQIMVQDTVTMAIRADEVVFRTENEFGIFETQRGWGIVLKLRVVLGNS